MNLNLITALNHKIKLLDSDKTQAILVFNAVGQHIEAAFKHLLRGQQNNDLSAFTDVVYRTNLAFDCCTTIAYQTLAGKNPESTNQLDIENYLCQHKILPSRTLKLLIEYRQQWRDLPDRNYLLSVNQTDAFMAITTIFSLAFLLIDQIEAYPLGRE